MKRQFAEDTKVPCVKSRMEVEQLLWGWMAEHVQWTVAVDQVVLRFGWVDESGRSLSARFLLRRMTIDEARADLRARGARDQGRQATEARRHQKMRQLHRLLLADVKTRLNMLEVGQYASSMEAFVGNIELKGGRTVLESLEADGGPLLLSDNNAHKRTTKA